MRLTHAIFDGTEPVNETTARVLAVNEAIRDSVTDFLETIQTYRQISIGVIVIGVLAGIGLLWTGGGSIGWGVLVGGVALGGGGYYYTLTQSPAVNVTGIEKGYWTGYTIPDEEGVVVYDATGTVETTAFELERLTDRDRIVSARDRLAELTDFPVVMPQSENIEEEFTNTLEAVQREIDTAEQTTVEAPVVSTESNAAGAVEFFASTADEPEHVPVEVDIPESTASADVQALSELEQMAATGEGEAELTDISDRSRQLVSDLSNAQETAIELLNDHIGTAADAYGLVSYNFYCPDCQLDDIDSRVTLTDPQDGTWFCSTCRSDFEMAEVIPRHRLKDDLVNPVWDQLWIEKDDQRREIYENIEDQKQDLQEREFEQRREEIRTTTDRIRDLRSRIRDLKTQAKAAEGKVEEIGELMVKYDRLNEQRKQQFAEDVEESYAEIDEQTEQILEETRNEEQQRIDQAQKAAQQKAQLIREEERQREIEMHMAAQERADERKRAELEQQAAIHGEEMEMEKRQHREDWMLKTRGRTSISGKIDKFRMKKDRVLGASARDAGGES